MIQERIARIFVDWLVTFDTTDTRKNCTDIRRLVGYPGTQLIQERITRTFVDWLVTWNTTDTRKNRMHIHRLVVYLEHNWLSLLFVACLTSQQHSRITLSPGWSVILDTDGKGKNIMTMFSDWLDTLNTITKHKHCMHVLRRVGSFC